MEFQKGANQLETDRTSFITYENFLDYVKNRDLYEEIKFQNEVIEENTVPISIFKKELGAYETICKYLKENIGLKNKEIAKLTGRDSKSVWQAISLGNKKYPSKIISLRTKYHIPLSIIVNTKLSILESIVAYLKKKYDLKFHEIALLLERDDRTIWTVYNRAKKKK